MLLKWQINGLNFGLFFNEKIFKTALLFSASAPNPYTVSVGKPINPPFFNIFVALKIFCFILIKFLYIRLN